MTTKLIKRNEKRLLAIANDDGSIKAYTTNDRRLINQSGTDICVNPTVGILGGVKRFDVNMKELTPEQIEQQLISWLSRGKGRHLYNVSAPQEHITNLWREHIRRQTIGGIKWNNSVVWDYINRMTEKFGNTYKKRIITIKGKIINIDEFDIDMERLLFKNTFIVAHCFKLKEVEEEEDIIILPKKKVIKKKKLLILEEKVEEKVEEIVVEEKVVEEKVVEEKVVVVEPTVVYGEKKVIFNIKKKKVLLVLED